MKNIENTPEKIFDLIENFDYDRLAPGEKAEVGKYMSADEYAEAREGFLRGQRKIASEDSEIQAPSRVKRNVFAMFKKRNEPIFLRILKYKLPVYQAAAVALIVLGILFYADDSTETEIIRSIDTVFLPKPVYIEKSAETTPAILENPPKMKEASKSRVRIPIPQNVRENIKFVEYEKTRSRQAENDAQLLKMITASY